MRRNRYVGFLAATHQGYLVAFDMFWRVLESRRVDPALGAERELHRFIDEHLKEGWVAEATPRYGFVFMRRADERILVEVTPRNPCSADSQTFSPFGDPRV
jgi:hypothetical protein